MKKRNFLLNAAIILLLATITSCGPGQLFRPTLTHTFTLTPTNSLNPTLTHTFTLTPTNSVTPTLTRTPTPDPYQAWSTNFANLTDLEGAEIYQWTGTQLSIDTTNVHSGGKSIKDSGTVNDQHLLQTVFKIHGLTGRDTVDLADKTLSIEMYVPSGSPLSYLSIELDDSGNNSIMIRANIHAQKGRWYTYEADTKMDIALGSWQYFDWMHSPGIHTTADAINLLNNVQIIKVNGQNDSALNAGGDTYFQIDKLGWVPSGALPAYNPSVDSLRKYAEARNLPVGAFIEINSSSDPQYMRTFLGEFDLGTAFGIYWPTTEPAGDNFDAAVHVPADVFLENVAGRLGSPLIRYALQDIPGWLPVKSYTDAQTILENYVGAQVSYHKGKTKIWVLNELLRYDIGYVQLTGLELKDRNQSPPQTWANNYSPFSNSPSDVTQIEAAFRVAREADPDALLFLNEGGGEEIGTPKADAYYRLAAKLVGDGTPIDGVGLQAHLYIGKDGTVLEGPTGPSMKFNSTDGLTGVAKTVERYEALGLKVAFTEVDVPIWTADIDSTPAGQSNLAKRLQLQAEVYRSLMHIALTHSNVVAFVFQGWADQYSWVDSSLAGITWCKGYGDLGIFDMDYQPKPAYDALLDELKSP
jgi:GH35 family endo-1,4-beta-xylanase